MNSYITLDGKKYKCPAKAWTPINHKPSSIKPTLVGTTIGTYGVVTVKEWRGEIEGPITVPDSSWGTVSDLRTTLAKRQTLSFTDHYGVTRTVHVLGPNNERSLSAKWDSPSNIIFITVQIKCQEAA